MNTRQAATLLFTNFAPEEREIPDNDLYPGRNASVLAAMNGALQEVFGKTSPHQRSAKRAAMLYAPAQITVSVTEGSSSATVTAGWVSWMEGCGLVIDGHDYDNRILKHASGTLTLEAPYAGTTGSVSATAYCDSVSPGEDVMDIHDPLKIDNRLIHPKTTRKAGVERAEDYGDSFLGSVDIEPRLSASTGYPTHYHLDNYADTANKASVIRIRLSQAPKVKSILQYRAKLRPPQIVRLEDTADLPIPHDFIESLFMPIARHHLMSSPFFRNTDAADDIAARYQDALNELKAAAPQKNTGMRLKPSN